MKRVVERLPWLFIVVSNDIAKMNPFNLTLPSNSSMNYYPNNTLANYVTNLPYSFDLPGEWEFRSLGNSAPHFLIQRDRVRISHVCAVT